MMDQDFADLSNDVVSELGESNIYYIKGNERREITAILRNKMPKSVVSEANERIVIDGFMAIFHEPTLRDWTVDTHDLIEARGIIYEISHLLRCANGLITTVLLEASATNGSTENGASHIIEIED